MQRLLHRLLLPLSLCLLSAPLLARPTAPAVFCETEPDAALCQAQTLSCFQCHDGPPSMNAYGEDVQTELLLNEAYDGLNFDELLPAAILEVNALDSDGDGFTNAEEIALGTLPGDPASLPAPVGPEPAPVVGENAHYSLGEWDATLALKRVKLLYCGEGPSLFEMDGLAAAPDPRGVVHDLLDDCLASDFWRDEALPRLADPKIRPVKTVGTEGSIVLGDYDWDYRLFAYALTGDRPASDLLLADYHVDENNVRVEGVVPRPFNGLQIRDAETGQLRVAGGQPVEPENRAGMVTSQWFIGMNTMFSQMPRTTAAQAYRAYLGLDIAKGQGLSPVENEPRDVDGKGVTQPACAACHSTLDPLSYAFSAYNGFDALGAGVALLQNDLIGAYNPERTPWEADGSLFGTPVANVREWAELAASRDEFKRATAEMFFEHALGGRAAPEEVEAFDAMWTSMPQDFTAAELIHALIDLDAFGRP